MKCTLPFGIRPKTIGRLAAGLLLASTLAAASVAAHPQYAAADQNDLAAPTVLSVRLDGTEAYVTFRDNSSEEVGYRIEVWQGPGPLDTGNAATVLAFDGPGVPGEGHTATRTVDGLTAGVNYCAKMYAEELLTDPVHITPDYLGQGSPISNTVCADPPNAGTPPPSSDPCGINSVNVTTQGAVANYSYDYFCSGEFNFQVTGLYDSTSKRAEEIMQDGATQISAAWTCPSDPWGAGGALMVCTLPVPASAQNPLPSFPITTGTLPFSVRDLPDGSLQTLAAALQAAIKLAQDTQFNARTASPTCLACRPQVDTSVNPITTSPTCIACQANGQTSIPVLPDFAITRITADQQPALGFTSTYDVVLANLGAKPTSQVQVEIQVTGSLHYLGMVQTPAGFTCTGTGPIICVGPLGGYGDPAITTSATFQLQVFAASAGTGAISAYADPNNLITESNKNNNGDTLSVTVN